MCGFAVVVGNGVVAFLTITRADGLDAAVELTGLATAAILTAGGLVGAVGYLAARAGDG